ncbi:general transcription factor IIE subunit 1 [Galendromus occidentalis]|uniref:General transcription factor IIE subunit 1 n=1 Tax=Galendromus occidentalis TaxID=34638 RepID=A0AAJ6VUV3_9ACAR|nr:general transcription factor IIE subunit 1 [Galendromus occidentalis]
MDVVHEVPADLKRLVKLVTRGFYTPELGIVADAIMKHQCVCEEALADLLKFERKQLRQILAQMQQDRIAKARLRMETGPDGKSQKNFYYYIPYQSFVNFLKYKLDLVRQKIETEDRESTSRTSFKCQGCAKCYTDLEADRLIDFATGELRCHHCRATVEEAESEKSSETPQQLLVRFNEQMEPLFALLRQVENVRLAPDLLEPEPKELEIRIPGQPKTKNSGQQGASPGEWSGDSTRYAAATVTVGEAAPAAMRETKEIPMWLQKSTVLVDEPSADFLQNRSSNPFPTNQTKAISVQNIMEALLSHERRPSADGGKESEEEEEDEWEEVPEEIPMVMVGGEPVAIHDITQELVDKMSKDEKRQYIAIAQQLYSATYE